MERTAHVASSPIKNVEFHLVFAHFCWSKFVLEGKDTFSLGSGTEKNQEGMSMWLGWDFVHSNKPHNVLNPILKWDRSPSKQNSKENNGDMIMMNLVAEALLKVAAVHSVQKYRNTEIYLY